MKRHVQFEHLESRQLLAADVLQSVGSSPDTDTLDSGAIYASSQTSDATSASSAIPTSGSVMSGAPYFGPADLETRILKIGERYLYRSAEEIVVYTPNDSGEWEQTASLDLDAPILELVQDDTGTRLLAVTGYREGSHRGSWYDHRDETVGYHLIALNEDGSLEKLDQMSRVGGESWRTELGAGYHNIVEFDKDAGLFVIHHAVGISFSDSVQKNNPAQFEFNPQKGKNPEADYLRTVYLVDPLSNQLPDNPVVSGFDFTTRALNRETLLVTVGGTMNIVDLRDNAKSPTTQLNFEEYQGRVNISRDIELTENGLSIVGHVSPLDDPYRLGDWGTLRWNANYDFEGFQVSIDSNNDADLEPKDRKSGWAIEWYKLTQDREYAFHTEANLVTRLLGGMQSLVERVDGEFVQHKVTLDNYPAGTYVLDQDHVVVLTVDIDTYPIAGETDKTGEVSAALWQRNSNNEFVVTEKISLGNDFSTRASLWTRYTNLSVDGVVAIRDYDVSKVLRVIDGKLNVQTITFGDHSGSSYALGPQKVAGLAKATIIYNELTGEAHVYPASQTHIDFASDVRGNGGATPDTQSPNPNSTLTYDTDGDGIVSPLDVLALINYLNAQYNQGDVNASEGEVTSALDVDGDGSISPLDVLAVINYLNGESNRVASEGEGFAEGENTAEVSVPEANASISTMHDENSEWDLGGVKAESSGTSSDELFSEVTYSAVPFYTLSPANAGDTSATDLDELRKRGLR